MTGDMRGKTIAIIGGAGFIGHHLALAFARRGSRVEVVDSLQVNNLLYFASSNGDARELNLRMINQRLDLLRDAGVSVHPQDAREYHALSRILGHIKPDIIVHLAAVSHAGESNKDPFSTFDHSLRTLENALDFARDGIERFVFFSSSMVYGNFQQETVDEEHPLDPVGIYGALKLAGEKIVIAYQQVFDLPYTIIRPSALYGPRCVSRRVSQRFIENALLGRPLRVEGDGTERLDFTYIDDLVEGVCLVIEQPAARNQTFNMTYGRARSIQELAAVVQRHFPGTPVEYASRDRLMPVRGTLSVEKAAHMLGYSPRYPLELGCAKYVEWYRQFATTALPAQNEAV